LNLNFKKLAIQFNSFYWIREFNRFNPIQSIDIHEFVDFLAPNVRPLGALPINPHKPSSAYLLASNRLASVEIWNIDEYASEK